MAERTDRYDPADLVAEARRQRGQVGALAAALGEPLFAQRPAENRWSVGECIEHLTLINKVYLDAIDVAVAQARQQGRLRDSAQRRGRHGWLGDLFVRSLEPPPKPKGKAFKQTVPGQRAKEAVVTEFLQTQDRLIRTIGEAGDIDFARARMRSPFFRALELSLGQAFGAMLAHNRRHIWQADGVLALIRTEPHRRD